MRRRSGRLTRFLLTGVRTAVSSPVRGLKALIARANCASRAESAESASKTFCPSLASFWGAPVRSPSVSESQKP
jgi:hypothetical protein